VKIYVMSTPLDKVFRDLLSCIFDRWAGLQVNYFITQFILFGLFLGLGSM
jgi:hypothetical protein